MEIDRNKIEAAIVQEAAQNIISDDALYERVKRDVDARVDRLFAERVTVQISTVIDEIVQSGFDRTYQKRDAFGGHAGEPTTIRAELGRIVGSYWTEMVGHDGKAVSSTYNTTTRAEWLMTKICADDFQKEVKQHAINVTGALKDGFRAELQQTVNRLLAELFHVRSTDDQATNRQDSSIIQPKSQPVVAADALDDES